MFVTAQEQLFIFIMSVLCGMCLGIFYDLFKVIRRLAKPSALTVGIQDSIFWVIAAVGVFIFLLMIDDGRMRFYELCTIFASWLFYELTISRYIVRAGVFLVSKLLLFIALPVKLICKIFKKPVFLAVSVSRKGLKRTGRILANTGRKWYEHTKNFKKMRKKI